MILLSTISVVLIFPMFIGSTEYLLVGVLQLAAETCHRGELHNLLLIATPFSFISN